MIEEYGLEGAITFLNGEIKKITGEGTLKNTRLFLAHIDLIESNNEKSQENIMGALVNTEVFCYGTGTNENYLILAHEDSNSELHLSYLSKDGPELFGQYKGFFDLDVLPKTYQLELDKLQYRGQFVKNIHEVSNVVPMTLTISKK